MKKLFYFSYVLMFCTFIQAQEPFENFDYLDPLPNAKYINPTSTILIRPKSDVDINTIVSSGALNISASITGSIPYSTKLADNNKIVIVKPSKRFTVGDVVTLNFTSIIKKKDGTPIDHFNYTFTVTNNNINKDLIGPFNKLYPELINTQIPQKTAFLPYGIPEIKVTYSHFPSPGKLFFNNLVRGLNEPNTPHLLIVDNEGNKVFAREMPRQCYDLNLQPNGQLTYYDDGKEKYFAMNSDYNIVDTIACGNGYSTDLHELKMLPNGNYLIMSYDTRGIDSIGSFAFASTNVIGIIVQEIDRNKDVIFQWRSWDYFKITDATHENLNAPLVDYCHSNAIDMDTDGNLLLSSRNMDEITKIDRVTGRLIWRLGGKNNQFTFINDTIGFSHQHAIRRIKNGNITLFDNGNFHTPPFSRAVEYKLDEVNKTATLVWQYRNTPDIYAPATGYVQRLDNNNTIICWGLTNPTLCEVRYDGTKVLEMTLPEGTFSYRAYKYEWKENPNSSILPSSYSLLQNYPNPFNPATTIKFTVPLLATEAAQENVRISIYDITGSLVKVILNERFSPGTYSVNYDASGTSSGVYFYKADIGSFTETRKMILVK